jgi:HD-GYP domain-containing protein (c-di-GMP phosphodiesterase class II)
MLDIANWVLHHHERFDGAGYPAGIGAEEIPLESRILHVADSLETMTATRVRREALGADEALFELEANTGPSSTP